MDIRSPQARHLQKGFDDGKIQNLSHGLRDTRSAQAYYVTTNDRFVRHDETLDQYNVLSADRRQFVLVDALPTGEVVDTERKLGQLDLLPPLTPWQKFEGAVPSMGQLAFNVAVGAVLGTVVGSIVQHAGNPFQYILNHLPRNFIHTSGTAQMPAGAAPSAGPTSHARHSRNFAADDFPDFDPWEASDRWSTQFAMDAQQAQREAAADRAWCQQNQEACEARGAASPTAADYAVMAAGGGVFAGVAGIVFNGMFNGHQTEPMRATGSEESSRRTTVRDANRDEE